MGLNALIATLEGSGSGTISGGGGFSTLHASLAVIGTASVMGSGGISAVVPEVAGVGTVSVVGFGGVSTPRATLYGFSATGIAGTGGLTARVSTLDGIERAGGGGISALRATLFGQGQIITSGSGGISARRAELSGIFAFPISGTGGISAPIAELYGTAPPSTTTGTNIVWATNLTSGRSVEYENYDFNSFFRLGNNYYGCAADGIYLLSGDKDVTTNIDAYVTSGVIDHGVNTQVHDFYTLLRSDGDMELEVTVEETTRPDPYCIPYTNDDGMQRRRVMVGKGLNGNTWQFTLRNTEGCDFTLAKGEYEPIKSKRRVY